VIGGLARRTLLWAGRNPPLRNRLSKQPVIAEAARRFAPRPANMLDVLRQALPW
jgi:hypothetical protein